MSAVHQRGFTLVELVVAMTVAMIVMGFIALFLTTPVEAYFAQSRRAGLTDSAEAIVRHISRDVRSAVPNSLRFSADHRVMEILLADDVIRYAPGSGDPARELDFDQQDGTFLALSRKLDGSFDQTTHYLVIGHEDAPGLSAYEMANVITPLSTRIQISESGDVTLTPQFQFASDSPSHSAFLVSQAVAYVCDLATQTLRRYSYPFRAGSIDDRDTHAELVGFSASSSLIARNVSDCFIDRAAPIVVGVEAELINVRMTLTTEGESFPLYHQTAVEQLP
jgi:MSHA biogenesis protein MshO